MIRPQIIVIDGPDGVGKTTQVHLLEQYLRNQGCIVFSTRASGGTPIGEELRKASLSSHSRHPETDMYISLAMHGELGYDIRARRDAGEVVIVDRSPLAVIAYNTYGSQMQEKQRGVDACVQLLEQWDIDTFIFMDAPQHLLDERRTTRGKNDYFESQGADYHHRVREGYEQGLDLLNQHGGLVASVSVVDASKPVNEIHAEIIATVAK